MVRCTILNHTRRSSSLLLLTILNLAPQVSRGSSAENLGVGPNPAQLPADTVLFTRLALIIAATITIIAIMTIVAIICIIARTTANVAVITISTTGTIRAFRTKNADCIVLKVAP